VTQKLAVSDGRFWVLKIFNTNWLKKQRGRSTDRSKENITLAPWKLLVDTQNQSDPKQQSYANNHHKITEKGSHYFQASSPRQ
jgi:hypothetical protein